MNEREPSENESSDDDLLFTGLPGRYRPIRFEPSPGDHQDVLAEDTTVGRSVVVRSRAQANSSLFARGARVQAQLEHPSIVPVYEIGVGTDDREYMTLPPVRGVTLRRVLDGVLAGEEGMRRRFGRFRLLSAFLQICLAIDNAHARGVLHRRLQPEGIVLGDHGEVYVVDWSFAKTVAGPGAQPPARPDETIRGQSPWATGYAAPEQLIGDPLDERTDVYALGAILFEILAGVRLHPGATVGERTRSTLSGALACPSLRAPEREIPAKFDEACVRATALDPKYRYASARQLHDAVEKILQSNLDAERRSDLAIRHAENAESLALRALTATTGEFELRAKALEEAGRAFALDPDSLGARRALQTLLREDTATLPPEAQRELDVEYSAQARAVGAFAVVVFAVFALLLCATAVFGIRSWPGFAGIFVPVLSATAAYFVMSRLAVADQRITTTGIAMSFIAIGFASGLYGALVLVPTLAVAITLALNAGVLRTHRRLLPAMGIACVGIPVLLEQAGVVPPAYIFRAGEMVIVPVVRELPELPVRAGLLLGTILAIVAPTLFSWRVADKLTSARERMHFYGFQLGKLIPSDTRASASVDAGKQGDVTPEPQAAPGAT